MKQTTKTNKKLPVQKITLTAVFAGIIFICSITAVPLSSSVPVTFQSLGVILSGIVLGGKCGAAATAVYVCMGAIGLPVFNSLQGGVGVILGPTGGFILSFPFLAFAAGIGADVQRSKNTKVADAPKQNRQLLKKMQLPIWLLVGTLVNYICGTVWFCFITRCDIKTAVISCIAPFALSDIIKMIIATTLGNTIKQRIKGLSS